jgi:hypothetical protein
VCAHVCTAHCIWLGRVHSPASANPPYPLPPHTHKYPQGEHCDGADIERQLGIANPGEDDPGQAMHMDTFIAMVQKQGAVVAPIE